MPQFEFVELKLGEVLYESYGPLSHVYFPTTAIVSLLYVMESGASAEIAVVGYEGIVGISLFMGGESTPGRAVVQSAGQGFRLSSKAIKEEFDRSLDQSARTGVFRLHRGGLRLLSGTQCGANGPDRSTAARMSRLEPGRAICSPNRESSVAAVLK